MFPDSFTTPSACFRAIIAFMFLINLSVGSTHAQLPDYLPADGLVGWWPFNGNANDESGNGNDGTVNGATLTTDRDGNANSAYSFDGVNDYIEVAHSSTIDFADEQTMTLSYWFTIDELPPGGQEYQLFMKVLGGGSSTVGYQTALFNSGMLTLRAKNGTGTPWIGSSCGPISPSSSFYNVVHIITPVSVKCYLNGAEALNVSNDQVFGSNEESLIIGWNNSFNNMASIAFNGNLDDIGLWNRALTPEEVTALYTGVPYVAPCADPAACNFNEDGDCVYAELNLDCDGNCLNDCNGNGVCDEDEVFGCSYPTACNYSAESTSDDGSCVFPDFGYDCAGNCLIDLNNNGLCDLDEVAGCTAIDAVNYNENATLDDGSCIITCKGDFDNDGQVTSSDLLSFLAAFGLPCSDGE